MDILYETKISDARWWVYDILGNAGWITWLVCLVRCLRQGPAPYAMLSLVPMLLMLVGIVELVSERVARLDRVLPRIRVLRGFGALTLGGLLGIPVSAVGILTHASGNLPLWMMAGAILCAVFAGLCFAGYRPRD